MSKIIRRTTVAAASALLLSGGLSVQQATASTVANCDGEWVCAHLSNGHVDKFAPVASGQCKRHYSAVHYMANWSWQWQRVWSGPNCTGANKLVAPKSEAPINYWWSTGGY